MPSNKLINEKSPYLLQHAHNPVDWYPWGEEAFERARIENKPIFLSVGYATCHWCHVMEKESFEDQEAAGYLNDTFICIKVDRERRPDIDSVYMAACQMLTGRGGWPLTVFLTQDKKPFFAATYIPKTTRFGRPGLIEICKQVKTVWTSDREKVFESAMQVSDQLSKAFEFHSDGKLNESVLKQTYEQLESIYDSEFGGFGPAPKFPTPHRLLFLLAYYHRTNEQKALDMVDHTLRAMRLGGIWDHVGYGFHRYSTDKFWLLPHFEKMLYDQALMALAYLGAFKATGADFFAKTAEEIFSYILREMTDETGGFHAAQDADSEGEEGKFYVWTVNELRQILGPERGKLWQRFMNMSPDGNFTDEAAGKKTGANILHLARSFSDWAKKLDMDQKDIEQRWEKIRETLYHVRKQREAPLKDDKILTDWNGLMIGALAMGARILGNYSYTEAAKKAFGFIRDRLTDKEGNLLHRFRDTEAKLDANANDYAFLIFGLLQLYQATFDPEFIKRAIGYQERMLLEFWDDENGGFFLTPKSGEQLPARPKELYDGAIPSANSMAFNNLLYLSKITGETRWEEKAMEISDAFSGTVKGNLSAFSFFLAGLEFAVGQGHEIVIVGEKGAPDTQNMLSVIYKHHIPNSVVILKTSDTAQTLAEIAPFTEPLVSVNDRATAYVCTMYSCSRPTNDPEKLKDMIRVSR